MRIHIVLITVGLALGACGGKQSGGDTMAAKPAESSLYDRLGGKAGITKVVDMFVANVAADTKINKRFEGVDIPKLKQMLVDQICDAASGGTQCKYTGKDMKTAHTGMNITGDEFGALVGDLVKALDDAGVAKADKDALLSVLGGMQGDIVGK